MRSTIIFILRAAALLSWLWTSLLLFTILTLVFVNDEFTFEHILIFIAISCLFTFIGVGLWSISNRIKIKTKKDITGVSYESIEDTILETSLESPKDVLVEMKKYYLPIQAEGDIRILKESVEIILNTNNLETFIGRFELAQRTSLTLEQAKKAGVQFPADFISFKELNRLKQSYAPKVLKDSYKKMKREASKLKTKKGRLTRYEKYYKLLVEKEFFLEEFEEYENIIRSLERDINNNN